MKTIKNNTFRCCFLVKVWCFLLIFLSCACTNVYKIQEIKFSDSNSITSLGAFDIDDNERPDLIVASSVKNEDSVTLNDRIFSVVYLFEKKDKNYFYLWESGPLFLQNQYITKILFKKNYVLLYSTNIQYRLSFENDYFKLEKTVEIPPEDIDTDLPEYIGFVPESITWIKNDKELLAVLKEEKIFIYKVSYLGKNPFILIKILKVKNSITLASFSFKKRADLYIGCSDGKILIYEIKQWFL